MELWKYIHIEMYVIEILFDIALKFIIISCYYEYKNNSVFYNETCIIQNSTIHL